MEFQHESVLLNETIRGINPRPDGIYVDGTIGGGGHALLLLKQLSPKGRLIGLDQDGDAIKASEERLREYQDSGQLRIYRRNFADIPAILKEEGIKGVDGIYLDLGVSSHQFDEGLRGFSYRFDGPLDMRMDQRNPFSAEDVVNDYDEERLYRIIKDYGEERFARSIAKKIVCERKRKGRIKTTGELAEIISSAIPMKMRFGGKESRKGGKNGGQKGTGHPAKRSFQAIRIEVNRELEVLENSLDSLINSLHDEGRLAVISFHSLEDRIVKQSFLRAQNPCICPPDFPVCVCGRKPRGIVLTKKAIVPTEEEKRRNRRAENAKLRIFIRRLIQDAPEAYGVFQGQRG